MAKPKTAAERRLEAKRGPKGKKTAAEMRMEKRRGVPKGGD